MLSAQELVQKVTAYDPTANPQFLEKAYTYAIQVHGDQMRESGELYYSHPIAVAEILINMHLDHQSIITALLHDTVEDTLATLDEIEEIFGKDIANLVDGVTKLSQLENQPKHIKQAENFRKFVLAMSKDLRVLLVKLADRLHNMRTIGHVDEERRQRIARETIEIYAPLAERIGMQTFKDELETIAFNILYPDEAAQVAKHLSTLHAKDDDVVHRVIQEIQTVLEMGGVTAAISGREKSPYSIWRKMQDKNLGIDQLSDLMAFRVVVKDIGECYQALGILHSNYFVVPGRFKDYISTPKLNGYKSIHTVLIGPLKQRIEVQIRTEEMHKVAEYGVAAHWQYKQGFDTEGQNYAWLRSLLEILDHANSPEEFLEHTKLEMFQDQVFAFTPRGDLIVLPNGATVVDFAYAVHSKIGDCCHAAKINGRLVPLRTQLKNGDQVEILTNKSHTPSPTWERFVVTGRARACIRRFLRNQQREQYVHLGQTMVHRAFKAMELEVTDKALQPALKAWKCKNADDLCASIGIGHHTVAQLLQLLTDKGKGKKKDRGQVKLDEVTIPPPVTTQPSAHVLSVTGLINGIAVRYAGCCHPVHGDPIVGIVMTGRGISIHHKDCENLENFTSEPDRWLEIDWHDQQGEKERYTGRLKVTLANRAGALATVASIASKFNSNIVHLNQTNRFTDFVDVILDLEVHNLEHLNQIINAFRTSPMVASIARYFH